MLALPLLSAWFFAGASSTYTSPGEFCATTRPQPHIIISQIMGIWFGKEIIYHRDEQFYKRTEFSCPIIHISEDKERTTTYNPLYGNYDYKTNYGPAHGYDNSYNSGYETNYRSRYGVSQRPQTTIPMTRTAEQQLRRRIYEQAEYDRQTTYGNYPNTRRKHLFDLNRHLGELQYLRVIWDESGETTEFHMRFNITHPGFWMSSGPEARGSSLDPKVGHLAGTIQVLKAVGDHMVLTFCHVLPEVELFTIILSRELKFDHVEILKVHNMLNRRGLRTTSVAKVCSGGSVMHFSIVGFIICLLKILFNLQFYR
ncbi:unnamed protein product [Phyllotreta striolata]|uniref:Uncharacterized protein n=1 Tax=Phyllotreta striolata TaxID=444603 RepID=A0A9N9XIA0_PHYSR|nr:unnamed protein product [Phyllotreta striolata]